MRRVLTTTLLSALFFFNVQAQEEDFSYKPSGEIMEEAITLHDEGEYKDAIKRFNQIPEGDTNYRWAVYEKILSLLSLEEYEKVVKQATRALASPTEHGNALYSVLGSAYDELDQPDKAIETYTKGIALYPMDYNLYFNLGVTLERQERFDEAVENYKRALQRNPFHASSHLRLGALAANEGRLAMAMMSYDAFLLMEPASERSLSLLITYNDMVGSNWKGDSKGAKLSDEGEDDFENIDNIIQNRIALDKKYKTPNKLKLSVVKQNYALMEALKGKSGDGFWYEFYVPFLQQVYKDDKFNAFMYYLLISVKDENIVGVLNKNTKLIKAFPDYAGPVWRNLHEELTVNVDGEKKKLYFVRNGSKVSAAGEAKDGKSVGYWEAYNNNGSVSGKGTLNDDGDKIGLWTYFYSIGVRSGNELYKNGVRDGMDSTFYNNGYLSEAVTYANGAKEGTSNGFRRNGVLQNELFFLGDKKKGEAKYFYPIGTVQYVVNYDNNIFEGSFKEFYDSGELAFESIKKEGETEGLATSYYRSGQIKKSSHYKDGALNGISKSYYADGTLKSEGEYLNGNKSKFFKEYSRTGVLIKEGQYDEEGKVNGTTTEYDPDGNKHIEFVNKKGEIVAYRIYKSNGDLIKEAKKKGGKFLYEGFYADGTPSTHGTYEVGDGGQDGEWLYYDENGVLSGKEFYKLGSIEGNDFEYYPNGNISTVNPYHKGKLNGVYKSYYVNGQLATIGYYVDGNKEGMWYGYSQDGTLSEKKFYLLDNYNGPQRFFDVDGKADFTDIYERGMLIGFINYDTAGKVINEVSITPDSSQYEVLNVFHKTSRKFTLKANVFHGPSTSFYNNGKKKSEVTYFNGNKHGKSVTYYQNGQIAEEGNYFYGNKDGLWKEYFENGKTSSEKTWDKGEITGTITWYNDNGTKSSTRPFVNGEIHGEANYYDGNGKLEQVRIYHYGKIVGYTYPDSDGKLKPVIPIVNETAKVTTYYPNGNVSREYVLDKGLFQGPYKEYYENGQLFEDYVNIDSENDGDHTIYYDNGKVKSITPYKFDEKYGVQKLYRKDGTLEKEISWKSNKKHGETRYYDRTGKKIVKTVLFIDGIGNWQ